MNIKEYLIGIKNKDISILSKAITLIESSNEKDKIKANRLIDLCLKEKKKSKIICISGPPGVGKSTFIDTLGNHLIKNNKIAILAIDPSSKKTKGSILADKTRMSRISSHPNVFIRPSPNEGILGGINKTTRESIILCEVFGFNIIIIETVGVGQSEIIGHSISDCFILLTLPNSGDQIQAIKKGIIEFADVIIIHKSDTIKKIEIEKEKNYFSTILKNEKIIESFSSISGHKIEQLWEKINFFSRQSKKINKQIDKQINWLNESIKEELELEFYKNPEIKNEIKKIKNNIITSNLNIKKTARKLVKKFLK